MAAIDHPEFDEGNAVKWTVSTPRIVAEDDRAEVQVEADSIEEAIKAAVATGKLDGPKGSAPCVGQIYNVWARVEVVKRPSLPLRSV